MSTPSIRRALRKMHLEERVRAARIACEELAGELSVPSTCDLESCLYRAERVVADIREVLALVQKKEDT